MGVASGCGEQEVGVASASGWNLWVWLLGVVVRRYINFLILLIPTLVSGIYVSQEFWSGRKFGPRTKGPNFLGFLVRRTIFSNLIAR